MARVSASFVFQKLEKMVLCPEPPPKLKLPECNIIELTDDDKHDSPKLEKRTRMHHIGRHRSCVVPLSDNELNDLQHRCLLQTLEVSKSPGRGSQCSPHEETPTDAIASHRNAIADAAWEALKRSIVYFRGEPIGTVAAIDKSQGAALNYDQVFMRDFIPSALAFLMNGEHFIVKNFLVETARLQSREKMVDLFKLGQGVMPASFKGIYGYPIEIQALFFMAMRCALSLLKQDSDADFVNHITKRIQALSYHLHSYYWLDFQRLNDIYCYKTEEYSQTALNKFNVIPESIPDWIFDFMPSRGGYFIGNVGPARMDFRWFCLGNFIAILSSLATGEQAEAILDLVEERWEELIGEMPLKICYPAMENQEWQIVTGCDPKNTRWSYHNGGSWPGTNYWAEIHHCLRGMNLIINLSLSDKCGAPIALMCTDGRYTRECRMGIPMQACLRAHYHNHPPKTIACFTEAASTSQIAHKHPDSFQSSFWKNLVQGYNKFHSGNSLDIRSIFQRAMAGAPLVLMISLSFSGAVDANPALLSDDGSITSIMSAFLCGDVFSKTVQKLAKEPSEENGPNNTASISLDDLDEFISSYLKGIGRLRWWCETYGIRVDLSKIFGSHIVVFTTPPAGTFFFPVKYNGRVITFSLYGRNLYLMGWRTPKGTFELKGKSCHRKNYMSGNVTILPAKKNYRFLAPAGDVGNVRLGFFALRESFEVLYKSNAGTSDVYQAMATFAVHLAEAARIQSILKDVHDISLESSMGTLDSRRNNSLWVNKYGDYSRVELTRINQHLGYEADSEDCDDGVLSEGEMSEVETLQQIRVFPRDVKRSGAFEHEPVPEDHPTEDDSYLEDKRCSERSKRKVKYTKSKKASLGGEGSTLPFYLLEDWFLDRDQDSDDEKQEEEEEIDQDENEKPMSNEKVREVQMTAAEREEFLNQFPLVKKLVTRQTQEHQDYCCQSQIIEDIRMTGLRLNDKMPYPYVSCAAISSPHMQIELGGAIGRKIIKPTHPAPSSVLLRGARVFSRFFRFAL